MESKRVFFVAHLERSGGEMRDNFAGLCWSWWAFMSNGWPFSLLNDEQTKNNKVGVEHQPVWNYSSIYFFKNKFSNWRKIVLVSTIWRSGCWFSHLNTLWHIEPRVSDHSVPHRSPWGFSNQQPVVIDDTESHYVGWFHAAFFPGITT